ncbi:RidA family protein [Kitasatospora viridis]|uniref:Enamine deaminase RidA (YjgF/YER057c/UK114 family) n=1 Tax=Kitasatospora viridis TaxID=281105 RepID=A0A561UBA1_9ACTN|nr:enamine deaminase RidA (YjgF/YER057c/UK114 family) [Kitasatospora viridis]
MSENVHLVAPEGLAPGNGYSHVAWGTGRTIAVSGQVAFDEKGELVGPGDPEAQARQVFENLGRALAAAGATFADVLKLTFYVTDRDQLPALRVARDAVIDTERPPASTAMVVAGLFRPDVLVEVDALAVVPADAPAGTTGTTGAAAATSTATAATSEGSSA